MKRASSENCGTFAECPAVHRSGRGMAGARLHSAPPELTRFHIRDKLSTAHGSAMARYCQLDSGLAKAPAGALIEEVLIIAAAASLAAGNVLAVRFTACLQAVDGE